MVDNYSALIVDIKKSKSYDIHTRNEVQEYLTKCIRVLNTIFQKRITCDVTFSGGDELQGLFSSPVAAILYWRMLEFLVYPVQIRAGIGIGEWNVRIEGGSSTEQDGPAYHNARNAIEEVYKRQMQSIRIHTNSEKDIFTNYLLNNSMGYKRLQNYMQNMLQLVSELMYPFVEDAGFMADNNFPLDILELKQSYTVKENTFSRPLVISQTEENNRKGIISVHDEISITDNMVEVEEIVVRKGMNQNIAKVMNKTRQNIDVVMKRGNVTLIRGMDYMALQHVKENYGEQK